MNKQTSDGSTASYYELPSNCRELQELISHRDMNAQIGEIFRACYRYGQVEHSDRLRDAKKIKFYAEAEIKRLEALTAEELPKLNTVPMPDKEQEQEPLTMLCPSGVDHRCSMISPREGHIRNACRSAPKTKIELIQYLTAKGVSIHDLNNDLCKLLHCGLLEIRYNKFYTL